MSPVRALGALLGILTAWAGGSGPVDARGAAAVRPPTAPLLWPTFSRDLEILHLRAHAAADRLAEWDVGMSPAPPPRKWAIR